MSAKPRRQSRKAENEGLTSTADETSSTHERQYPRLDVAASTLLGLGLLAGLCIFSYDPADPPAHTVYPPRQIPSNLVGYPGAWLAHLLFQTLGVTVYLLFASWFALVVLLFLRRSPIRWAFRLLGCLALLPSAAVVADWIGHDYLGGPLEGSGGSLGGWLAGWLAQHFAMPVQVAIVAAWGVLSLIVAADVALLRGLRILLTGAGYVWRATCWVAGSLRGWAARSRTPVTGGEANAIATVEVAQEEDGQATIPIHHHTPILPVANKENDAEGEHAPLLPITNGNAISESELYNDYELPPIKLLEDPPPFPHAEHDQRLREMASLLEKTFTDFSLNVRVVGINTGPVITQYEIALETGLRVAKVTSLGDDLALNLKVPSVRIAAPIPGKNTVGIEVPNEHRAVVGLKDVLVAGSKKSANMRVPLFLGKDTEGRPLVYDLAEMPHLLIAGRTGTGKSVCLNVIILSILMTRRPDEVKMILIDPKMTELIEYARVPHLMHPVVKDMDKAEAILSWAVDKMEERYDLLSRARVRNIASYNELSLVEIYRRVQPADEEERKRIPDKMPSVVLVVDEFGDLMMRKKKEVEGHIIRLAQKSRAAGIHLVVATQKPTVDVITGLIKSNLPARICFQVSSRSDSRVVLDEMGADKLLGKGDMLFLQPGTSTLIRAQGTYASDREIGRVVEYLETEEPSYAQELVQLNTEAGKGSLMETLRARDDLYEPAVEVIVREQRGSVSLLQRALGIGYGKAARFIDYMAEDGIVGPYNGSNAREVLYSLEQWEQMKNEQMAG